MTTRTCQLSLLGVCLVLLALVAPRTEAGDTTCATDIAGTRTYTSVPVGGTCVDATRDAAAAWCAEVWTGDWEAWGWSFGGKYVTGGRGYPFSCADGVMVSFDGE